MGKKKFLVCGACFAGNMGGSALYESFLAQVEKEFEIKFLLKYPRDEIDICIQNGYSFHKFTTVELLILGVPFFIFGSVCKKLHLPHKWLAIGPLKQYYENDVMVDLSGIAFSDYRGFVDLIINTLWFLPAFVSGIPIIKLSQSLGPYEKKSVNFLAKYVLSRIRIVIARGNNSYKVTKQLLPNKKHIFNFPDVAMCLPMVSEEECGNILEGVHLKGKKYVTISPSIVVDGLAGSKFYRDIMKKIVKQVYLMTELPILFVPHTRNCTSAVGVNNGGDDAVVCADIIASLRDSEIPVEILLGGYNAKELKSVIAGAEFMIGSRYHSLIAAMSSGVPSLALGWGHKYYEMFELFGMEKYVFEYREFNEDIILKRVRELAENYIQLRKQIEGVLPNVKKESEKNVKLAIKLIRETTEN